MPCSRTSGILITLVTAALFKEAVSFAFCGVKVGNYWPTISSFLMVVLSSLREELIVKT